MKFINGLSFLSLIRIFQNICWWRRHVLGPIRIPQLERIPHWERIPDWERIPGDYRIRGTQTYTTQCCVYHGNAIRNKKQALRRFWFLLFFSGVLVQNMMGLEYGEDVAATWTLWKYTYYRIPGFFAVWTLQGSKKKTEEKKKGNTPKWCESGMCSLLRVWRIYSLSYQYTLGATHAYQQPIAFLNHWTHYSFNFFHHRKQKGFFEMPFTAGTLIRESAKHHWPILSWPQWMHP